MAAAAAAESGTPREEDGLGGEAATPQPQAPTNAPGARLSRLPLARVKALVKADPDVTLAGQEAIFILARAAVRRERKGTVCGDHCKRRLLLCSARKEENPPEERFG
ncbi:DNA polymerase epsilon subunit 4 isoform X2 [Castor canadensis]|uniref:DNA polymerase epsilon subunit 4 isoform X2 n=1 Tax=Castor canadensis TaxID=51338 RepID=A0AC58KMM0_CASCN